MSSASKARLVYLRGPNRSEYKSPSTTLSRLSNFVARRSPSTHDQVAIFLFIMGEAYLRDLENVWRSERLVFRATQQEDYNFIFNRKSLLDTTLTPSRRKLSHLWLVHAAGFYTSNAHTVILSAHNLYGTIPLVPVRS